MRLLVILITIFIIFCFSIWLLCLYHFICLLCHQLFNVFCFCHFGLILVSKVLGGVMVCFLRALKTWNRHIQHVHLIHVLTIWLLIETLTQRNGVFSLHFIDGYLLDQILLKFLIVILLNFHFTLVLFLLLVHLVVVFLQLLVFFFHSVLKTLNKLVFRIIVCIFHYRSFYILQLT